MGGTSGGAASVWVVIVVYTSYGDTSDCLRSLEAATWPDLHIVLVDNGSSDGSGGRLRDVFPDAVHIRSEDNLGFAGGCNLGIRAALAADADYICLLNNDTMVEPGFIEPLVARAAASPAILGGKIFYDEPGDIIWFAGGDIDRHSGFTGHRGQDRSDSQEFNQAGTVDYITGCLLLAPAQLFRELGLLDDRLFMYCEELDFCLRARRAGYPCLYEPASVIRHRVSRSMGGAYRPLYYYYQTRNLLEVYRTQLGASRLSLSALRIARHLVIDQSLTMVRAHRTGSGPYIAALWTGLADYLRGRLGRCPYRWLLR